MPEKTITVNIDGHDAVVPYGTTILEAAEQMGIEIPLLCYFAHTTANGLCRLCVVEVEGSRVLEATYVAIAQDGAIVKTSSPRVRRWAKQNVLLLTPAGRWQTGRYAQAYHRFIQQPQFARWLASRKTAIEPVFDLFSKVLGTTHNQKQLPLQGLANVRTFLSLGVLAVQIAMIVNNIWGLPLRQIVHILSVFS